MILYNYTSLKQRDTKIYNIGGYNLAGGLSVEFLKVVAPVFFIVMIIGWLISIPFGLNFLNPLGAKFVPEYTITFMVIGIGIGCALWYIPITGYRLYQYLGAYFKPKKIYMNDFRHTEFKLTNIHIKAFVKNLL